MKREYSCGAVLFTKKGGTVRYLLVKEKNENIGFPKGHMEKGETEHECALREIYEETGIKACIVSGFCERIMYPLQNGHIKHVTYFAAFYDGAQEPAHTGEVNDFKLLEYDEAVDALSYGMAKNILKKFAESKVLDAVKER